MSRDFVAPVDDITFALAVVGADRVGSIEIISELVDEFGRFCAEVVAPLNRGGDEAGVRFDPGTGAVQTAPGWSDAYSKYVSGGWNGVSFGSAHGGGQLPWVLTTAMQEVLNASSMAFALCPMLTQGAAHLLHRHGSDAQRERYLVDLVSGASAGTMLLTEPGAGSDVGALVTRAVPRVDGTYSLHGQKIFITYGEHDLTDQIVHIVLARLPDAPQGTKGISCFLAPKVLPDGSRNAIRCVGVEHKMGIHASPTCTMDLDGAVAELIDAPNGGMQVMFSMMNNARLAVAVEGVGVAVRAHQAAAGFARERVQGGGPIVHHPDVRRMLVHMRSHIEAMRLLTYRTAVAIDAGEEGFAGLLTPLAKAWCTETGASVARLATQVHGGMGYVREAGVEQHERDVRIAAIYEGTNGIQAIDLVSRKLHGERADEMDRLVGRIADTAVRLDPGPGRALGAAADVLARATALVRQQWRTDRRDALAGATPFLELSATVVAGWLMASQLLHALDVGDDDAPARVATATYFLEQVLPRACSALPAIEAGCGILDAVPMARL